MADFQARRVICPDPATAGSIGEDLRLCRLWWLQGQKCLLLAQAQFTLNLMSALFSARLFRWSHFFTSLSVVACRPCLPANPVRQWNAVDIVAAFPYTIKSIDILDICLYRLRTRG